jgi:hypothetical protein
MSSVAAVANKCTVIVQMVAFSDPSSQLPRYLETMEEAGLQEMFLPALKGPTAGYGAACLAGAGTAIRAARPQAPKRSPRRCSTGIP